MTPAEVERTKLLANAFDRASTACFTVGIATPLAGYVYHVSGFRGAIGPLALLGGLGGWLVAAIGLHIIARQVLKGCNHEQLLVRCVCGGAGDCHRGRLLLYALDERSFFADASGTLQRNTHLSRRNLDGRLKAHLLKIGDQDFDTRGPFACKREHEIVDAPGVGAIPFGFARDRLDRRIGAGEDERHRLRLKRQALAGP